MIDAERILSSLVRNALSGGSRRGRRRGKRGGSGLGRSLLSGSRKGAVALGALGVAIAAFEHFTQDRAGASGFDGAPPSRPRPPASPPAGIPPPPPPAPQGPVASPAAPRGRATQEEALLLVRAMIAAANADHRLDDRERARIVEALDASGLDQEERGFLLAELESPLDPAGLAAQAGSGDLARQVYLASLMAIDVDTAAEREHLARLAGALGLSPPQVAELEQLVRDAK